jgi:hypothetical protein
MGDIVLSIVILFGIIIISLLGLALVRRSISISTLESHHEVAGFIYAVVGVVYAVLMAFVVLVVWEQYNSANEKIEYEATNVAGIYRNSFGIQDSVVQSNVQSLVKEYAATMIHNEFPANLKLSNENREVYTKFWNLFYGYVTKNENDKFWFSKTVESLEKLQESRRMRLLCVDYGVPGYMWFVLIFGAVITIGFSYLFGTKKVLAHAVMVFCLSGIIGLVLILIDALEHPFSGIIHIKPESFEVVLKFFQ